MIDLEHLLRKRSVPYSSELRDSHLQGMVTFLPAGDVSHRDFVTHAWADNPIKDILLRMDDSDQESKPPNVRIEFPRHIRIEAQLSTSSAFAVAAAGTDETNAVMDRMRATPINDF